VWKKKIKMGSTESRTIDGTIDNEKWVKENILHLDPENPQKTFEYVTKNHPFCGCSSLGFFKPDPFQSIEEHAKRADAVTVACFEFLGNDTKVNINSLNSLKTLNDTAVANMAYVALHHSNEEVRKEWTESFNQWKKANE